MRKIELPLIALLAIAGAAFLLKMCYLSLVFNCAFGLVFLAAFYAYMRGRHGIDIPMILLALVFAALQVDALGNFFRMYGRKFGPLQYDEFSHMAVQVLITPIIIWLFRRGMSRRGHNVSVGLAALLAGTIMFSLTACYEVIELWDEVYFGGQRIWGKYDTANDLQWDLCGIIIGSLLALQLFRVIEPKRMVQRFTSEIKI